MADLYEYLNARREPIGVVSATRGLSAYEVWLAEGNTGTEEDFLTDLRARLDPAQMQQVEDAAGRAEDAADKASDDRGAVASDLSTVRDIVGSVETRVDTAIDAAIQSDVIPAVDGLVTPYLALADDTMGVPIRRLAPNIDLTGETYQRAALQAAINIAGQDAILLPRNSKLTIDSAEPLRPAVGCGFTMRGSGNTVLEHFEESVEGSPNGWAHMIDLSGMDGMHTLLEGLVLLGKHRENRTQGQVRFVSGVSTGDVTIRDVDFHDARTISVFLSRPGDTTAERMRVFRGRRDGLQVANPLGFTRVYRMHTFAMGDDSINIHANMDGPEYPLPGGNVGFSVTECEFVAGRGITIYGMSNGRIERNTWRYNDLEVIRVATAASNGANTTRGITPVGLFINDNYVENPINRDGGSRCIIDLRFWPANGSPPPGRPNANGMIERTEGYYNTVSHSDLSNPVSAATAIHIDGNIVRRTMTPGSFNRANLGDWVWRDNDEPDRDITDGMMRWDFIGGTGSADVYVGPRNDASGLANVLAWDLSGVPSGTLKIHVDGGRYADFTGTGAALTGHDGASFYDIDFSPSVLDGDPFCADPGRGAGGKWTGLRYPSAYDNAASVPGFRVRDTLIRNVSRVLTSAAQFAQLDAEGLRLHCDPAGTGGHSDNRGIGAIVNLANPNGGIRVVIEGSDPTDADNFGRILNACPEAAGAMPSSGKWVEGQFVRNMGSGSAVIGWRRMTTGSGHVPGTDWEALTASRATPFTTVTADSYSGVSTGSPGSIISDTAALTGNRNRGLQAPSGAPAVARYLCRTTGGYTVSVKSLANSNPELVQLETGDYAEFLWDGTEWRLMFVQRTSAP